ncbi:hypothetical protein MUP59_02005 [Candidatus Bathyarchaeota archaeon]|nr:hypothetical protein [Candidatus Bathyarchaeota archaeon]
MPLPEWLEEQLKRQEKKGYIQKSAEVYAQAARHHPELYTMEGQGKEELIAFLERQANDEEIAEAQYYVAAAKVAALSTTARGIGDIRTATYLENDAEALRKIGKQEHEHLWLINGILARLR